MDCHSFRTSWELLNVRTPEPLSVRKKRASGKHGCAMCQLFALQWQQQQDVGLSRLTFLTILPHHPPPPPPTDLQNAHNSCQPTSSLERWSHDVPAHAFTGSKPTGRAQYQRRSPIRCTLWRATFVVTRSTSRTSQSAFVCRFVCRRSQRTIRYAERERPLVIA